MKKILFVCLGNICRSPMAEFIAKNYVTKNNLNDLFHFESAGLHSYHEGENMHIGTQKTLKKNNIEFSGFKSKPISKDLFNSFDYIFVMDNSNLHEVTLRYGTSEKVDKITNFSTLNYDEVPDPWYTNNFDETFEILNNAIFNLINKLKK